MDLRNPPGLRKPATIPTPSAALWREPDSYAEDCRAAVESLPHLVEKLSALWNSRDLDTFIHTILMDSREGQRRGLPIEVAKEMMFLSKLNTLVRAMDAAPALQMSVAEASDFIVAGEHQALGLVPNAENPWSEHAAPRERTSDKPTESRPTATAAVRSPARPSAPAAVPAARKAASPAGSAAKGSTDHYLSLFLNEEPPIPAIVRVDLSLQETARAARSPDEMQSVMSSEFFRCITREIKSLGVDELVLSHLGEADKCPWLADAVRVAKQQCRFHQVSLRVDLLTAGEQQLDEAIAAGLDCLAIDFNMSSKSWMAKAEAKLARDPGYFAQRLAHLLQKRDEIHSRTLHRCQIKLSQIGKIPPDYKLAGAVEKLAEMADTYSVDWLPDLHDLLEDSPARDKPGSACLCWTPFIEANVLPNGHLVVCTHDIQGTSFVADLKQTEFAQAWHDAAFAQTRRGLLEGRVKGTLCANCPRLASSMEPIAKP